VGLGPSCLAVLAVYLRVGLVCLLSLCGSSRPGTRTARVWGFRFRVSGFGFQVWCLACLAVESVFGDEEEGVVVDDQGRLLYMHRRSLGKQTRQGGLGFELGDRAALVKQSKGIDRWGIDRTRLNP
jgi:hypothetical protein